MTILTTLPNGGNLSTDGLTTHCYISAEPFFQRFVCLLRGRYTVPLVGNVEKKALAFSRQTEPKRLAFRGNSGVRQLAGCFRAGSRTISQRSMPEKFLESGYGKPDCRTRRCGWVVLASYHYNESVGVQCHSEGWEYSQGRRLERSELDVSKYQIAV